MSNFNFEIEYTALIEDVKTAILSASEPENIKFASNGKKEVFVLSPNGEIDYPVLEDGISLDRSQIATNEGFYIAIDESGIDMFSLIAGKVPLHSQSISFSGSNGVVIFRGNEMYSGGSNYSEFLLSMKNHAYNVAGRTLLAKDREEKGKSLKAAREDIYNFADENGLIVLREDAYVKDEYGRQSSLQGYQLAKNGKPIGEMIVPEKIYADKKTPEYILRAQKNYTKKVSKRSVVLNKESDSELIQAIDNDDEPFNQLVKRLLNEYYNLTK